ncbi:MAG: phosphoribosylanthranilate isomerase [Pseudomonadota bacterium]|nr:phosphoribosylanthranilate isomerase [Pseudomonadota bacterium]
MSTTSRTRVKICGITRPEDGIAAALAGADAIGLVFYDKSPRAIDVQQAQAICAALPPFVTKVGLFVNASHEFVSSVLTAVPLDLLQFHGDETGDYCHSFRHPYVKALRMKPDIDLALESRIFGSAQGILVDAWHEEQYGGTGISFDWSLVGSAISNHRLILAGGLKPANVARAIEQVRPWAVDVSSGVESAPGIKDNSRIEQFISEVQRV